MEPNQNTAVVQAAPRKPSIAVSERGIVIDSMDALWRFSQYVSVSGLAPKGLEKQEAIFVAVQMGLELGMTPMSSLTCIAVINGRPTMFGDAQLGLVRASGELEEFSEWYEVGGRKQIHNPATFGEDAAAVCHVKRRGFEAQRSVFSVADAKRAQLWGKTGPWSQYPARMLRFRARAFILRDNFGDVLRGIMSAEEARDIEPIDVTPEKATRGRPSNVRVPQFSTDGDVAPVTAAAAPETQPAASQPATEELTLAADPTEPSPSALALGKLLSKAGLSFDDFKEVCKVNPRWATRVQELGSYADLTTDEAVEIIGSLDVVDGKTVWKSMTRRGNGGKAA